MGRVRHRACPIDGRIDCMVHPPAPRNRTYAEEQRRKVRLAAHVETIGQWCPGYGVPPHAVTPPNRLTADHRLPRSLGGEAGPLDVLCLRCNSRRAQG